MKKFFKKLIDCVLFSICAVILVFTWTGFSIFATSQLYQKILITILAVLAIIITLIPTDYEFEDTRIAKYVKESPTKAVFSLIVNLDPEEHIKELRSLRTIINNKITRSETNKLMIVATKNICGKNCKCPEVRKNGYCKNCEMYEAYVNYLKQYQE